jgi:hypothetical protein
MTPVPILNTQDITHQLQRSSITFFNALTMAQDCFPCHALQKFNLRHNFPLPRRGLSFPERDDGVFVGVLRMIRIFRFGGASTSDASAAVGDNGVFGSVLSESSFDSF